MHNGSQNGCLQNCDLTMVRLFTYFLKLRFRAVYMLQVLRHLHPELL